MLRFPHLPVKHLIKAVVYSVLLFLTTSVRRVVPKLHYKSPCQMVCSGNILNYRIQIASVVLSVLTWMVRLHNDLKQII